MDARTIGLLFHAWVVVAVAIGSGLIAFFDSVLLARVGAVVIMLGLVSLMPAFNYTWWEAESTEEGGTSEESGPT